MICLEDINRDKVYVDTEFFYVEFYKGKMQRVRFIAYSRTLFFSLATLLEISIVKSQDIFNGSNRSNCEVFCNYATEIINAYPTHKEEDIIWRGYRPYVRMDLLVPMLKSWNALRPHSPDRKALEPLIEWLGSENFDKGIKDYYNLGIKHLVRPNASHYVEASGRNYSRKEYFKLLAPHLPEVELEEARFDNTLPKHSPRATVFVKTPARARDERKFYALSYKDIVYINVVMLISMALGQTHIFLDDWGGLGIGRRDINTAWAKDLVASTKALQQLTYTDDKVASAVMHKGEVYMSRRSLIASLNALVDRTSSPQKREFVKLISWLENIKVREAMLQAVKTRNQPKKILYPLHSSYSIDYEAKKAAKKKPKVSAKRQMQLDQIKQQKEASGVICYQGQTFKKPKTLAAWDYPSLKELLAAREGRDHARH